MNEERDLLRIFIAEDGNISMEVNYKITEATELLWYIEYAKKELQDDIFPQMFISKFSKDKED